MKLFIFAFWLSGCGLVGNTYNVKWGDPKCMKYCSKIMNVSEDNIQAGKDESGKCICEKKK